MYQMKRWNKLTPEQKHRLFIVFICVSGVLTAIALIGKITGLLSTDADAIVGLIAMVFVLIAASLM